MAGFDQGGILGFDLHGGVADAEVAADMGIGELQHQLAVGPFIDQQMAAKRMDFRSDRPDPQIMHIENTVDLFRSMDIPVRTLECCSGDLADLKVKSIDVEAWSPRQKKYFEVGSCSNLGDAQARRLKIRVNGKDGKYFAHTLNNTVVAPPRMLIAFLENNLQADGSVRIPDVLVPYMGGKTEIR